MYVYIYIFTLRFSPLADAFIQSDLQIKKVTKTISWNSKYDVNTFKKMEKLNKMTNAYISQLNI